MLRLLVLLHSSGASVNGEAGIGTNALLRKVTSLERSVRLELGTQMRGGCTKEQKTVFRSWCCVVHC